MAMKVGAVPVEDIESIHINDNARILEIGADSKRNFMSKYPDLMSMIIKIKNSKINNFITLELTDKNKPSIVADGRDLPFKDSVFDVVILISVLEHCYKNFDAIIVESRRVVSKKGVVIGFVPFFLGYHGNDYWRFTYEGVERLLNGFERYRIVPIGGPISVSFQIIIDMIKPNILKKLLTHTFSIVLIPLDKIIWKFFKKYNKDACFVTRGYLFIGEK